MIKVTKTQVKRRRGITLLETVIALAVIMLVSSAGVSVAVIFSKAEAKNLAQAQAASYGESVVECFRYCENNAEMESSLALLDGEFYRVSARENGDHVYRLEKKSFVMTVISDLTHNKLEIQIVDNSGNEMNKMNYEKS